jgi:hypothetical protein
MRDADLWNSVAQNPDAGRTIPDSARPTSRPFMVALDFGIRARQSKATAAVRLMALISDVMKTPDCEP